MRFAGAIRPAWASRITRFRQLLEGPAPLAGMAVPYGQDPWLILHGRGFRHVVCLMDDEPGYDPAPLGCLYAAELSDLAGGSFPADPDEDRAIIGEVARAIVERVRAGEGVVVHMGFADPFCPYTSRLIAEAGREAGATVHEGGTYVCIEGPQFSTRAESNVYRQLGFDIIGMTNLQEAKLAREAELCYATMAMVTDYDVWYEGEEDVTLETVLENVRRNVDTAQAIVRRVVGALDLSRDCELCNHAVEHAINTPADLIPAATREKLDLLIGRYLG